MFFRKKRNPKPPLPASSGYQVITQIQNCDGWHDPDVAARQDATYRSLIAQARAGQIRQDLQLASEMLQVTQLTNPLILEVGCGSGYYYEILSYLSKRDLRYIGVDNSQAMTGLAKANYPYKEFITADATRLPFSDQIFDVVFNGVSLMHIPDYRTAISESRRTSKGWCIFHTVPVLERRATTIIKKTAYGSGSVMEIIFNEGELMDLFEKNRLRIKSAMESIPYNLEEILNEKTVTKTYLCEVLSG